MTDHIRTRLTESLADRYSVERELGGGGMSRVFVAMEHALGRRVVIKTLPEDATLGDSAAERFRREILTAARIEHANIVPVLAAGDIGGTPYFVMPWVDGDSLRQRLQRGRVPVAEAISILRDVARALAAAHQHGVAHRDIKPENVLLSGGAARVTDFGVAKALSAATQSPDTNAGMTAVGLSIGTPAYMAPEQLAADPALDHRADIYAWGLVAYELLSGRYAFHGLSGAALLQAQLGSNPPALTTLDGSIPVGLSQLVSRTLAKEPANRPQSASELIDALDSVASGANTAANPVASPSSSQQLLVSRRKLLAAVGVALLLVIGYVASRNLSPTPEANDEVIAVAPFRVSAPPQMQYLREGIADLMVPQLASIPRVRPPSARQMFAAWKNVAGDMNSDLDDADLFRVAGTVGAGRVIIGSVVSNGQTVVINAQLRRIRDGNVVSDSVMGVADSVVAMTARLTAKLLLVSEGADRERIKAVMHAKPEAITKFLNGERYYRSGRYADALVAFGQSYAADTTFPLVHLRIYTVNGWVTTNQLNGPWVQRALAYRAQLTGADSMLLEAYNDPLFPAGTPPIENMKRLWDIALRANSAEMWYVAGDAYFHNGLGVGVADAMDWALDGFKRAEAIDSTYVGAIEHQPLLYLIRGDTVNARAADSRQARIDSTGDFYTISNASLRLTLGKQSELPAFAHSITQRPVDVAATLGGWLQVLPTVFKLPTNMTIADSVLASKRVLSELVPGSNPFVFIQDAYYNSGRIAEAEQMNDRVNDPVSVARGLLAAMYWDGDSARAGRAAASIAAIRAKGRDTTGTIANTLPRLALALWSLEHGDEKTAREIQGELQSFRAPANNPSLGYPSMIYSRLLQAQIAVKTKAPEARQYLSQLDSTIINTARLDRRDVRTIANVMVAGMWDEVGDPERAFAASSRRDMQLAMGAYATAFLRVRATAAEKTGRKEDAIQALRTFVTLREKADAPLQADVQAARDRLKALERKQ